MGEPSLGLHGEVEEQVPSLFSCCEPEAPEETRGEGHTALEGLSVLVGALGLGEGEGEGWIWLWRPKYDAWCCRCSGRGDSLGPLELGANNNNCPSLEERGRMLYWLDVGSAEAPSERLERAVSRGLTRYEFLFGNEALGPRGPSPRERLGSLGVTLSLGLAPSPIFSSAEQLWQTRGPGAPDVRGTSPQQTKHRSMSSPTLEADNPELDSLES